MSNPKIEAFHPSLLFISAIDKYLSDVRMPEDNEQRQNIQLIESFLRFLKWSVNSSLNYHM